LPEIPVVSVIDDSYSVRREVATVIGSAGYRTEIFGSAEEFIRSDQVSGTACLVLGVQLRGMSGLQLQSHLASHGRHIPIIFIAASAAHKDRELAHQLGAVSLQDKPSGARDLLKAIRLTLKSWDKG
jgi:FixJ family two-component response regulator